MKSSRLRALNQREKILLGLIIFFGLIAANRLVQKGLSSETTELDRRISELSIRTEKDKNDYQDLLKRSIASSQTLRSDQLISKIDSENDYFSNFVSKLAHQDIVGSFRILKLATDTSVQQADYIRTPVTLTVESSFPGVGRFLESLENSPTLVAIDSMEISRIESDLKKCSAKIKLSNYVVKR